MEAILDEKTYTIQQVAEEMDISVYTLRYYEKIGLLQSIQRGENGRRVYTKMDLGWVYWLKLLRSSGMSIHTMKRYVKITRAGDHTMDKRCAILEEHRNHLQIKIEQLQVSLEKINQKVEFYRGYEMEPMKKNGRSRK